MKLSFAAIVGALVATVVAKPGFTNTEFDLQEGKPFTLNWINATGPVTVTLLTGPDRDSLQPLKDLGTGLTANSLTFTPSGLKSGNYAFRINDVSSATEFNFSVLIPYVGTGSSSSSSATATVTTSVASTSSSTNTITSAATTETATTMKTSSSRTTATTTPRPTVAPNNNNNAGQRFSSPLALVIITVAALVFFN